MQDLGFDDEMEVENGDRPLNVEKTTEIRALNGEIAADEFAADAINYQVLIDKIDLLLDKLKLDA